jgi:NADH-quinone oxidoreductase subunit G
MASGDWERIGGVPMYAIDATTRRAHALQHTPDSWGSRAMLNPNSAQALGLNGDAVVRVVQGEQSAEFPAALDDAVPEGCIWLPTAVSGTETLGQGFAAVTVEKA